MRTGMLLAFGVAMCLLPAVSFAQQSAPAAPPKAPIELDQLKPFVGGTLECKGTYFASPGISEHATHVTTIGKRELDGFWYVAHGAEEKTAANPTPYKFIVAYGYDPATKKFVCILFDNLGAHSMETADSVSADKVVYTGTLTLKGTDYNLRDTYTPTGHDWRDSGRRRLEENRRRDLQKEIRSSLVSQRVPIKGGSPNRRCTTGSEEPIG